MDEHSGLETPVPLIDRACDGCGLCVMVCPQHVLGVVDQKAVVLSPVNCDYCDNCEAVCPIQAITRLFLIEFPGDDTDEKKIS